MPRNSAAPDRETYLRNPDLGRSLAESCPILSHGDYDAAIVVGDYNTKNPDKLLQLQSVMQDKVRVKYLRNDKAFPPGFQPAYALKDLLLEHA